MPDAPVAALQDINFFTTYRCNSRCLNCCIWQEQSKPEQQIEIDGTQLQRLFQDPLFKSCPNIGLAGGEPTISPFFWKLLDILPADKHVTVTTNALSNNRLIEFLQQSTHPEKYMIQVSVDGLAAVHDKIRGVDGSFKKAIHLLESLKRLQINRLLSFTINRLNYFQLLDCYYLAQELGARFSTRMAYCGGAYENKQHREVFDYNSDELPVIEESIKKIIRTELEKPDHSPSQLVFLNHITSHFNKEQKALPCLAMETGLVIDLYGEVFPNCPAMMKSLGSLQKEELSRIWSGKEAMASRNSISALRCGGCWNDCQVITNIHYERDFLEKEYLGLKLEWLKGRPVRDIIEFSNGEMDLLLEGWYATERDGDFAYRWTEPHFSFLVPEGTRSIEIFGMVPDGNREEKRIDAAVLEQENFSEYKINGCTGWQTYRIDFREAVTRIVKCKLHVSPHYCPKASGDGEDGRQLGMALNRIKFIR